MYRFSTFTRTQGGDIMQKSSPFSAVLDFFTFKNYGDTIVFSYMVFLQAITESQRRRLLLESIARIDSLNKEEKDPMDSSAFYRNLAKATFDASRWEQPRVPIIICGHQDMCVACEYECIVYISRQIQAESNLSHGVIHVPRVIFHCMEEMVRMRSRIPPLSLLLN